MRNDPSQFDAGIIPIAIRPDLIVRMSGIPFDLTKAEAEKIGRVVMALADDAGQREEQTR